jgi:hypothetical protein
MSPKDVLIHHLLIPVRRNHFESEMKVDCM